MGWRTSICGKIRAMFTYKAMRYKAPIEDEFDTLQEAIKRARGDHERDEAWPTEFVDESGKAVIEGKAMDDLLDRSI